VRLAISVLDAAGVGGCLWLGPQPSRPVHTTVIPWRHPPPLTLDGLLPSRRRRSKGGAGAATVIHGPGATIGLSATHPVLTVSNPSCWVSREECMQLRGALASGCAPEWRLLFRALRDEPSAAARLLQYPFSKAPLVSVARRERPPPKKRGCL